ncbi:MAG: Phage protein Gp19/Gp15/Gp42 [Nocardioidaceae bacterium]|jgi:hypothetical protein|nr:Phage protein Gp19/Gp15/Gp42 [Nocardioidaceae bacterium]
MATYATTTDVATRLGIDGFDDVEDAQCQALLEDVSEIMRARLPSLDTWITDALVTAGLAKTVACWLAMQCINVVNVGVGTSSETHPEHAVTISNAASTGVDLTDAQIDMLTPASLKVGGKPFSIRPGGDD